MIRKIYLDVIRDKLAQGNLPWLARAAARYPLIQLSSILDRPFCGPILASLVVTYRCNYSCAMCGMPSRGQGQLSGREKELDTPQMMGLIDQFRAIGTLGIGFTGGEPLLRNDLMQLLRYSKKAGMLTHLNTNGSLLLDSVIEDLVALGIDSLNISLDGATGETHDRIRGVPGAWEMATLAAREVVRIRGKGKKPRLKVVMVVDRANMEEVPAMVDFAVDLGVECLEFIPVQPFRANGLPGTLKEPVGTARRAAAVLAEAMTRARGRLRIENSPRMLALFGPAFRGEPSPLRCFAAYNSITVDCYGQVFPCLPFANWDRPVQGMEGGTLEEIWSSADYAKVRNVVSRCGDCTLNCQAELNLLFNPFLRPS